MVFGRYVIFYWFVFQVQEQLNDLEKSYNDSVAQLKVLKRKKEQTITRLQRAAILTKSLAVEEVFKSNFLYALSLASLHLFLQLLLNQMSSLTDSCIHKTLLFLTERSAPFHLSKWKFSELPEIL